MRVLVACEYSGRVRDAFRERGHDAISCDLLPTESPGPHYQGDVRDLLPQGWDLLIGFPPCTYLANSGVQWLHKRPERMAQMEDAGRFFLLLLNTPYAPRVALENPVPHGYARDIIGYPTQWIQPHEYGTLQTKKTGLWLRGLPPLVAWEDAKAATFRLPARERMPGWFLGGGRGHERSVTNPGIAEAMAEQWGES